MAARRQLHVMSRAPELPPCQGWSLFAWREFVLCASRAAASCPLWGAYVTGAFPLRCTGQSLFPTEARIASRDRQCSNNCLFLSASFLLNFSHFQFCLAPLRRFFRLGAATYFLCFARPARQWPRFYKHDHGSFTPTLPLILAAPPTRFAIMHFRLY